VVIYPIAVPVSIISKWEKSQLWIEPPREENLYNGVGFLLASERRYISSRSYEIGPLRGESLQQSPVSEREKSRHRGPQFPQEDREKPIGNLR